MKNVVDSIICYKQKCSGLVLFRNLDHSVRTFAARTASGGFQAGDTPMSLDPVRWVQSRFAETRFAETPTLTLTLNPNFGESGGHRAVPPYLSLSEAGAYCSTSSTAVSHYTDIVLCREPGPSLVTA